MSHPELLYTHHTKYRSEGRALASGQTKATLRKAGIALQAQRAPKRYQVLSGLWGLCLFLALCSCNNQTM